jgi:hypothetical protein
MAVQDDIFTMGKQKFNQIKSLVEEMEVQLALGKADARKTFESERKHFIEYVRERREALRHAAVEVAKDKHDLLLKFETLEEKLRTEAADTKEMFELQKEVILHAIYEVEHGIKAYYGEMATDVQEFLDGFKTKLDGYRIQLALGKFKDDASLETKKAELREAVSDMRLQLSKEENAKQKLDTVSTELTEAFDHFKKAFKEIFN